MNNEQAINKFMNNIGLHVSLIFDVELDQYTPIITTLPNYQGLVNGYCGLKSHKGRIVAVIAGLPTKMPKEEIRQLDDMFDEVKEMVRKANNIIEDCNIETRLQNNCKIDFSVVKSILDRNCNIAELKSI